MKKKFTRGQGFAAAASGAAFFLAIAACPVVAHAGEGGDFRGNESFNAGAGGSANVGDSGFGWGGSGGDKGSFNFGGSGSFDGSGSFGSGFFGGDSRGSGSNSWGAGGSGSLGGNVGFGGSGSVSGSDCGPGGGGTRVPEGGAPAPEPSSWLLMGTVALGAVVFAGKSRRRLLA